MLTRERLGELRKLHAEGGLTEETTTELHAHLND